MDGTGAYHLGILAHTDARYGAAVIGSDHRRAEDVLRLRVGRSGRMAPIGKGSPAA